MIRYLQFRYLKCPLNWCTGSLCSRTSNAQLGTQEHGFVQFWFGFDWKWGASKFPGLSTIPCWNDLFFQSGPIFRLWFSCGSCSWRFFLVPDHVSINVYAPKLWIMYKGGRPQQHIPIIGWGLNVAHTTAMSEHRLVFGFKIHKPFKMPDPKQGCSNPFPR